MNFDLERNFASHRSDLSSSSSPSPSSSSLLPSPPVSTPTSRTPSTTAYPDHPAELDLSRDSRLGRPADPLRRSSYSKRHASSDTPREVPFPAHHHSSDALVRRSSSFSGSNSGPTVSAASCPPSSCPLPQADVSSCRSDVPLSRTVGKNDEGFHSTNPSRLPSPMSTADGAPASTSTMTYKYGSEGAGSPRNPAESNRDQRNAGIWDSDHLRPHLLSSPPKGKGREHPPPIDHHQSLPTPYSPYILDDQRHGGIQAPTPTRPSSTLSLPLPSQMPFFALPATTSTQQQPNSGLPSVSETVQSNFDSSSESAGYSSIDTDSPACSSSYSHDPRALHRRASSPLNSLSALFESVDRHGRRFGRVSAAGSTSTVSTSVSASSQNSSASSSMPPPTPPTVHTPPPPPYSSMDDMDDGRSDTKEGKRQSAPHEPFLSHAPAPASSFIAVETTDAEYRLIVKLPGFRRDCIMLSTRRRRILHIAADSWEAGGGHFERRISFGYDADLTRVRAEFDGDHLRVLVPRKVIPVTWVGN